jgi:ketosteroid isomerase-like protein
MSKDIDELTRLNRDYVASVQNSDVKRFEEILAQDFYCSNPTSRGSIAPAIIHAATSYTTADGQHANCRYTDCWAKQNGRWLAVSAHVSR